MKYYLDTEFHEYQKQVKNWRGKKVGQPINTIDPISIGIISEDDRTYYSICKEFDIEAAWANDWLRVNVLLSIFFDLAFWDFHSMHFKDEWFQNGEEVNLVMFKANEKWSTDINWFKKLVNKYGKTKYQIGKEILRFVGGNANERADGSKLNWEADKNNKPEFWAYFADYDWIVFCWFYGRMIDLPKGYPQFCLDLKQKMEFYGLDTEWKQINCPDPEGEHNALVDAKWNKLLDKTIDNQIAKI